MSLFVEVCCIRYKSFVGAADRTGKVALAKEDFHAGVFSAISAYLCDLALNILPTTVTQRSQRYAEIAEKSGFKDLPRILLGTQ